MGIGKALYGVLDVVGCVNCVVFVDGVLTVLPEGCGGALFVFEVGVVAVVIGAFVVLFELVCVLAITEFVVD